LTVSARIPDLAPMEWSDPLATGAREVDLYGVIFPEGPSGAREKGAENWLIEFSLSGWRIGDGPLRKGKLSVAGRVERREYERLAEVIEHFAVLHLRVAVDPGDGPIPATARLRQVVGPWGDDSELNAHAVQLREPVTWDDGQLGHFELQRRAGWYAGTAVWCGQDVALHLGATKPDQVIAALEVARALLDAAPMWDAVLRDYAARALPPLAAGAGVSSSDLTPEQLAARIAPRSITVFPRGTWEFWFDDAGLLGGSWIQLSGNLLHGPMAADTAG
jgi:hypothetical protein